MYGIARQAGGVARIESEVGKGTTVQVWLPFGAQDPSEGALGADPRDDTATPGRILVIEDDEDVRTMIVDCLEALGYHVTQAPDGPSGLARLDADKPDVMMVDYAMPGMNGIQVLASARESRPDLPVILATGYADVDVTTITDRRFTALRKPFQLEDLARAVRLALKSAEKA